jgi:tRNA nucleotidyltransferase/poly(A) polymerase
MSKNAKRKFKLHPLLEKIGKLADASKLRAYLIGGSVRDLLQGRKNLDWDITVEGDPSKLVAPLARQWRAKVKAHPEFGTFALELKGGKRHIDFATARTEIYHEPGALPQVKFSLLPKDVSRRDFTINALAVALNGPQKGEVLDYCGGLNDLNRKVLRVLHERSFRDDPTRIFRLARFAGRGYKIEKKTEEQVHRCVNFLERVSPPRIREEMLAILAEKDPRPALVMLVTWGVIARTMPEIIPALQNIDIKKAKTPGERFALLLAGSTPGERREFLVKFSFERKMKQKIERMLAGKKKKTVLNGKDLIKLGYRPGPRFKTMLETLSRFNFKSKKQAAAFLFDKFPRKD